MEEKEDICGETGQKIDAGVTEGWRRIIRYGDLVFQVRLRTKTNYTDVGQEQGGQFGTLY